MILHSSSIWKSQPVYFLQLLRMTATFAIPRHIVEAYGAAWCEAEHLVTNGAFRLTEWIRGDKLVLTRNPDYRGRFSGNLARVELTLVPHKKITLDKYDTGEHDIGVLLDGDMIPQVRQQHPGETVSVPMAHTLWIGFDTTRLPFDDVRVRQALAHAVDRKTLCEAILFNAAAPATGGVHHPACRATQSAAAWLTIPNRPGACWPKQAIRRAVVSLLLTRGHQVTSMIGFVAI